MGRVYGILTERCPGKRGKIVDHFAHAVSFDFTSEHHHFGFRIRQPEVNLVVDQLLQKGIGVGGAKVSVEGSVQILRKAEESGKPGHIQSDRQIAAPADDVGFAIALYLVSPGRTVSSIIHQLKGDVDVFCDIRCKVSRCNIQRF
ncbi:MAG: hypothetical protein IJ174_10235, partial [Clostridia bacterium]|nr:hypothetical protein [Clostridia bacterium]